MRLLATKVVELLLICIKVNNYIEHGFLVVKMIKQLLILDILLRTFVYSHFLKRRWARLPITGITDLPRSAEKTNEIIKMFKLLLIPTAMGHSEKNNHTSNGNSCPTWQIFSENCYFCPTEYDQYFLLTLPHLG